MAVQRRLSSDNQDCNDAASDTSMDTITWEPPSGKDESTSRNGASRRPINTTRMPLRCANVLAVAAPMPLPAPVIKIEFMISKKQKRPGLRRAFLISGHSRLANLTECCQEFEQVSRRD